MKKFWIVLWCILLLLTGLEVYADRTVDGLSDNLLRLHIIATDDTPEAQSLKLRVRDRVLDTFGATLSALPDPDAVKDYVNAHLEEFRRVAEDELRQNGSDESVTVSFDRVPFDTRKYGNVRLPAGRYDALRIVIGEGAGKNWWCVLFPPLCFVEDAKGKLPPSSEAILQKNLDADSYALIREDGGLNVELRFKVVELWETAKLRTAQALGGLK